MTTDLAPFFRPVSSVQLVLTHPIVPVSWMINGSRASLLSQDLVQYNHRWSSDISVRSKEAVPHLLSHIMPVSKLRRHGSLRVRFLRTVLFHFKCCKIMTRPAAVFDRMFSLGLRGSPDSVPTDPRVPNPGHGPRRHFLYCQLHETKAPASRKSRVMS